MTIKDMEQLTGITKANIRYYEEAGLIAPQRSANGYRSYTEAHVQQLKRIKLLRALEIPIETLNDLCNHRITLQDALAERQNRYAQQHEQLAMSEQIVEKILAADENYDALNPDTYMALLEGTEPEPVPEQKLNLPWRRFGARVLDSALYGLLINLLIPLEELDQLSVLVATVLDLVLMILLEPVQLHLFGTTLGKWIFGIRVTALDGSRLTYEQAKERTILLIQHGLGLGIPVMTAIVQYRSLEIAEAGGELIWEQDSELTIRDGKNWRILAFALCLGLLMAYPAWDLYQKMDIGEGWEEITADRAPFGYEYRVAEVLAATGDMPELPLVALESHPEPALYYFSEPNTNSDKVQICTFTEEPDRVWSAYQAEKTWRIRADEGGKAILEYLEYGQMQWSWRLERVDQMSITVTSRQNRGGFAIGASWFEGDSYTEDQESARSVRMNIIDSGTITFVPIGTTADTLRIIEEIHAEGKVEVVEHTLTATDRGTFPMPVEALPSGTVVVYRIPYDNGEYVLHVGH